MATTPTPEAPKDTKEPETPPDSTDAPTGDVSGTSEATNEQKESNVGKTDEEIVKNYKWVWLTQVQECNFWLFYAGSHLGNALR